MEIVADKKKVKYVKEEDNSHHMVSGFLIDNLVNSMVSE